MNWREVKSNVSVAFAAQSIVMLFSVVQVLLVPKVLGIEQYGYWQLFLFYISFAGFFPLGLIDGVYLIHGGTPRKDIDKRSIFSQMLFGLVYESVFSVCIVAIALFGGVGPERELIIACTGVYILLRDVTGFISNLFQAMNETKRSSYSTIIERVVYLCCIVVLLCFRVTDFAPYILSAIFSLLFQLGYCLYYYRDFLKSGFLGWRASALKGVKSIRVGIKLMLANIASQLVIGIARFMLDQVWGIETFGQLSLMLSLAGFFLAFVNQIGMVLFPALRQTTLEEIRRFYSVSFSAMNYIGLIIFLLFFPISWIVAAWLPEYAPGIVYLGYLMPICVFDSKMSVACTTYFKVMREERLLLWINLGTVALSTIGAVFGSYVLDSVGITIASPVVAIVLRSIVSERIVASRIGQSTIKGILGELLVTAVFLCSISFASGIESFVVFACFSLIYLAFNRKEFASIMNWVHIRRG